MLAHHRILAVDIGATTIKVGEFQVSSNQGLRLINFHYADLGLDPEREENRRAVIVEKLRKILQEKKIRTKDTVFSLSGQSVFIRFVKLPPADESKVVQIIHYEARQNVPFPIDEVIWDYQLLGRTDKGELEVVLVAVKSNIIEDLNQAVESAGLRTRMVDIAPMALYNAVRYNEGDTEGCTLMLDIGARTTTLLFVERDKLFTRSIPIAGNTITQSIASEFGLSFREAEQLKKQKGFVALGGAYEDPPDEQQAQISKIIRNVMTRLHAEIGRSINFYRTQQAGTPPSRLLLSGGSSILPYTDRFFKEKLQVPVRYFNPVRNVEVAPTIAPDDLSRCAHFFGEVVGLGLRQLSECPLEVNLAPKSIRARHAVQRKLPFLVGAAVGLLLIPLCLFAFTRKATKLDEERLAQVLREVQRLEALKRTLQDEQKKLHELRARTDRTAEVVLGRSWWPEFLQDIHRRLETTNLWIVTLTPQAGSPQPTAPRPRPAPAARGGAARRPELHVPTETPQEEQTVITEIRIQGGGNHSANDLKMVEDFRTRLSQSSFFEENGVEVTEYPPDKPAAVFSFAIRARLRRPLVF